MKFKSIKKEKYKIQMYLIKYSNNSNKRLSKTKDVLIVNKNLLNGQV
jgi:hypothetical protein